MLSATHLTTIADKIPPFMETLGADIMDIYHGQFTVHTKSDNSPFTIADTSTEQKILQFLHHHTPNIPVYAEESFEIMPYPMPDIFWLVDPIDGTKGFVNRNNFFTINIGLVYNKTPVFGVIYEPQNRDIFIGFAWGDETAFKKNQIFQPPKHIKRCYNTDLLTPLCTDKNTGLSTELSTKLSTGTKPQNPPLWCSYKNHTRIQCRAIPDTLTVTTNADISKHPIKQFLSAHKVKQILAYTSSIKICMVAMGQADIYPRYGKCYEWDTCAGDAILRGAGGIICDLQGTPLQYAKPNLINHAFICMGR